jgi:hypothetical protein
MHKRKIWMGFVQKSLCNLKLPGHCLKKNDIVRKMSHSSGDLSKSSSFWVTPHINNRDYVGRPLDIKPCVSVTPHINNHDYMETEIEKENYTFMKEYLPEI